jgi:hypothetical protein
MEVLLNPGAPFFFVALAGALLAAIGLLYMEQARLVMIGVRSLPSKWGMGGRFLLGNLAAVPLAAVVVIAGLASGAEGNMQRLFFGAALALYLYLGVVIPRKPIVAAQKEAKKLRSLTPGFVNYIAVCLAGRDNPSDLLARYIERFDDRLAAMQRVVTEALELREQRRYNAFEALRIVARQRRCQELVDVTEALAQSETEGTSPLKALDAQEGVLTAVLEDEFKQMLNRRQVYLMIMVALGLVFGVLGSILWFAVAGSSILGG